VIQQAEAVVMVVMALIAQDLYNPSCKSQEDDIHTHRDSDNIVTTYKFIDNVWKITGVVHQILY
jgi:hypothetical protein